MSDEDQLVAQIAYMMDDPNSQFCRMTQLVDHCCKALGLTDDAQREIVGDHILRALWLGEGKWDPPGDVTTEVTEPEGNVVPIKSGVIPKALNHKPHKPHQGTIEELERALALARVGEVTGVAAVLSHHDYATSSFLTGNGQIYAIIGRLEEQKMMLFERIKEEDWEAPDELA